MLTRIFTVASFQIPDAYTDVTYSPLVVWRGWHSSHKFSLWLILPQGAVFSTDIDGAPRCTRASRPSLLPEPFKPTEEGPLYLCPESQINEKERGSGAVQETAFPATGPIRSPVPSRPRRDGKNSRRMRQLSFSRMIFPCMIQAP